VVKLDVVVEALPMRRPFVITGYIFESMPAIVVRLTDGAHTGRGEAAGVYYLDDGTDRMLRMVQDVRSDIERGASRADLQRLLPPGGARNALDCALWELDAARQGVPAWQLAGFPALKPSVTTMTAGADTPDAMVGVIHDFAGVQAIKIKLTGDVALDIARVTAMRGAFPGAWLGVDANQGYTRPMLEQALPAFVGADVRLVEQPLPRGQEAALDGFQSPIPLAADESLQSIDDLQHLVGRFQVANIKLDKSGGLTEGLAQAYRARELGLAVMVGNMAGTSWAMAPGCIVAQLCEFVDLDGPLALRTDRNPAVIYQHGEIHCADAVWGCGETRTETASCR
jgi:L-alanine-DL-glutamate epimerase-like enolase superfamily enzyme